MKRADPPLSEVPSALARMQDAHPIAAAPFENLPYSHKKEFLDWIASAKKGGEAHETAQETHPDASRNEAARREIIAVALWGSDPDRLGLAFRIKVGGNRADDARLEAEFSENAPDFLNRQGRFLELQVDDVVVAIDLVTQTGDGLKLVVEFEDFLQVTDSSSIYLKINHSGYFVMTTPR